MTALGMAASGVLKPHAAQAQDGLRGLYRAATQQDQVLRSSLLKNHGTELELVVRPSIKFHPSRTDFDALSERATRTGESKTMPGLPEGFPLRIEGDRVWHGATITASDFVIGLSADDVDELNTALTYFLGLPGDLGPEHICKDLFPLPNLGAKLERLSESLHTGRGVVVLRGLEPANFSAEENVILFTGLTSYIGEKRGCQDRFGNMITHITDMGFKFGGESRRTPPFTGESLPFHNDRCDILAMYAQNVASNGGEATIASSAAVYNEIAATRPDLIRVLSDPIWVYDKDDTVPAWRGRSILFAEPTHGPFFCFSRQKITGTDQYPLSPGVPAMTEAQAEALDLVHFVAEKHSVSLSLRPGDIMLHNNFGCLHGRNAFKDDSAGSSKRHLMRLWLRNGRLSWKTPTGLADDWHEVYGDSARRARACWKLEPQDVAEDRVIGHKMTCS